NMCAAGQVRFRHTARMKRRVFSFFALFVASFFPAAGHAADHVFTVTGVVRGRLDDGKLVIQHDVIPGFMPAMTMAFTATDSVAAARLQKGDHIRFRFHVSETNSVAEEFTVTGHEVAEGARPATPAVKAN